MLICSTWNLKCSLEQTKHTIEQISEFCSMTKIDNKEQVVQELRVTIKSTTKTMTTNCCQLFTLLCSLLAALSCPDSKVCLWSCRLVKFLSKKAKRKKLAKLCLAAVFNICAIFSRFACFLFLFLFYCCCCCCFCRILALACLSVLSPYYSHIC